MLQALVRKEDGYASRIPFAERKAAATSILKKYPDRVPIIAELSKRSDLPPLDKIKYLVPRDFTVGQFVYVIRKRIAVDATKSIFVFLPDGTIPTSSSPLSLLYREKRSEDGFLYFRVTSENVFG